MSGTKKPIIQGCKYKTFGFFEAYKVRLIKNYKEDWILHFDLKSETIGFTLVSLEIIVPEPHIGHNHYYLRLDGSNLESLKIGVNTQFCHPVFWVEIDRFFWECPQRCGAEGATDYGFFNARNALKTHLGKEHPKADLPKGEDLYKFVYQL